MSHGLPNSTHFMHRLKSPTTDANEQPVAKWPRYVTTFSAEWSVQSDCIEQSKLGEICVFCKVCRPDVMVTTAGVLNIKMMSKWEWALIRSLHR